MTLKRYSEWLLFLILPLFFSGFLHADVQANREISELQFQAISQQPIYLVFALILLGLLPFVGMLLTSFVKMAVVLSITRQAIGIQQAPPTTVITGLSILLTIYVMHPVGLEIYERAHKHINHTNHTFLEKSNVDVFFKVLAEAELPVKSFLQEHASDKNLHMFYNLGLQMRAEKDRASLDPDDLIVLVPSFIITELTQAFQIGFLIFLPFLVVDMAVSNILMALGMQMLSPTTISLPFKILLFVMADGWHLITRGLVTGYQL